MKESRRMSPQHKLAPWRVVWQFVVPILIIFASFQGQVNLVRASQPSQAGVSVFASGLDDPRGLKFGPDGYLYVAEGGQGGSNSTVGQCEQVPSPIGPYTGGMTARISKISPQGVRTTVVDGLPSSQTSPGSGGFISGVADVAFLKGQLYALLAGAGCSHGVPDVPNAVIRVNSDGTWDIVADLSAFLKANPVKNPEADDFEPDGTWYSMVAVGDSLFAIEPNHGELDKITPKGKISRVIDISASQGHIVPTSVDNFHGHFYVGNLETFPIAPAGAKILEINPGGKILSEKTGLTNIVSAVHDKSGNLYVLESTTGNPMPTPDTGMIVRISANGQMETIASGFSLPTAMTFGPDGALYVSNKGFVFPPGQGEIVRVELQP
jgi:glucose/arabinose dehydrogenase